MNLITVMGGMVNLILLAGLSVLSFCTSQNHFISFQTPKTWTGAQTYCREKCFDLATPHDMDELNEILQIVEGKYDDAMWFGLIKGGTMRWHWSLTGKTFYKEGEKDYLEWGTNSTYNCGTYQGGKLYALPCHHRLSSICFDEGEDKHVLIEEPMGWTEALNHCKDNYTDLTSVRNEVEHSIIQALAADQEVWVGYFKDPWEWSDKTDSSLRFWPPDQEVWSEDVERCGVLLEAESGRWGGRSCSETHPFVCSCTGPEIKQRVIKVRISPQDSKLDLNDPAVKDGILKQMMLKLNKDGTGNVKLQWRKHPDGRVFIKETP